MIPLLSPNQINRPTAIALGCFDGLHSGHKKVISSIVDEKIGTPTVASFWPHPREILFGETKLRIDLPLEKTALLEPLGIDQLVLIPFDIELASLEPQDFIHEILYKTLKTKVVGVGENFRFGRNRSGDVKSLQNISSSYGIKVKVIPTIKDKNGRMSSSRIRAALKKGDLKSAENLLSRPYSFEGKVVKGKGIGRKIGWPTANLEVNGRKLLPCNGVYSAWTIDYKRNQKYASVMNLGPQPTIDPLSPSAVEVHIINKDIDLLGQNLTIIPKNRIRGQEKFNSLDDLKDQISIDVETTLSHLTKQINNCYPSE